VRSRSSCVCVGVGMVHPVSASEFLTRTKGQTTPAPAPDADFDAYPQSRPRPDSDYAIALSGPRQRTTSALRDARSRHRHTSTFRMRKVGRMIRELTRPPPGGRSARRTMRLSPSDPRPFLLLRGTSVGVRSPSRVGRRRCDPERPGKANGHPGVEPGVDAALTPRSGSGSGS
jgi:hypothetical protein